MTPPTRYVLLDRDGTINVDRHYLASPEGLVLLPNAAAGLRQLAALGLGLVVITNQSGIGRGRFDESALASIHARLRHLLEEEGVYLAGIYHCPHTEVDGCDCRKPRTGLARRAAAELGFDPREAFVVGDKASDVDLGRALGAVTILVKGRPDEDASSADYVVADLLEAAQLIGGQLGR